MLIPCFPLPLIQWLVRYFAPHYQHWYGVEGRGGGGRGANRVLWVHMKWCSSRSLSQEFCRWLKLYLLWTPCLGCCHRWTKPQARYDHRHRRCGRIRHNLRWCEAKFEIEIRHCDLRVLWSLLIFNCFGLCLVTSYGCWGNELAMKSVRLSKLLLASKLLASLCWLNVCQISAMYDAYSIYVYFVDCSSGALSFLVEQR